MMASHQYDESMALAYWAARPQDDDRDALFWSWYEPRNFGDWIGPYLYEAITGRMPRFCPRVETLRRNYICSAGSILRHIRSPGRATVWGAGIISATDSFAQPRAVHAVRGPRTRMRLHALGYECPAVYGDPAILLPLYHLPPTRRPTYRFGLAPHFVDKARVEASVPEGVSLIDVTASVESVIAAISDCECVYASSLHGVIVSHAYGVPAVWIRSGTPIMGDDSKFRDYFESVGLQVDPVDMDAHATGDLIRHRRSATLPDLGVLQRAMLDCVPFGR